MTVLASSRKNNFIILVIAASVLLLVFYYTRYRVAPDIAENDIQFVNSSGDTLTLSDFEGRKLFVNCYASWCGPCMKEMPEIQNSWEKMKDEGQEIQFIALTDDSWESIEKVTDHFNLTFPVYQLVGDLRSNGIYTIPTSYFFNEKGELIKNTTGTIDPEKWLTP